METKQPRRFADKIAQQQSRQAEFDEALHKQMAELGLDISPSVSTTSVNKNPELHSSTPIPLNGRPPRSTDMDNVGQRELPYETYAYNHIPLQHEQTPHYPLQQQQQQQQQQKRQMMPNQYSPLMYQAPIPEDKVHHRHSFGDNLSPYPSTQMLASPHTSPALHTGYVHTSNYPGLEVRPTPSPQYHYAHISPLHSPQMNTAISRSADMSPVINRNYSPTGSSQAPLASNTETGKSSSFLIDSLLRPSEPQSSVPPSETNHAWARERATSVKIRRQNTVAAADNGLTNRKAMSMKVKRSTTRGRTHIESYSPYLTTSTGCASPTMSLPVSPTLSSNNLSSESNASGLSR